MRGNPLLRFVVFLLVLCGMGALVLALTSQPAKNSVTAESPTSLPESAPVPDELLHLQFESPILPDWVSITHAGTEVFRVSGSDLLAPQTLAIFVPPAGIELVVQASWSSTEGNAQALRILIDRTSVPDVDVTFWGKSPIAEVLEIPGLEVP